MVVLRKASASNMEDPGGIRDHGFILDLAGLRARGAFTSASTATPGHPNLD